MRRAVLLVLLVALTGCGEPEIVAEIPPRPEGQHVSDQAGILAAGALEARLAQVAEAGPDIVVLTYETEQFSCGEAFRAGKDFVETWAADIAVVAIAKPGDFTSDDDDRQRCLGVQPRDDRSVPGDLRERIAEELVPPQTAENDWDGAVLTAVDALADQ
jgi:uncharacterized membrane protein YgcG